MFELSFCKLFYYMKIEYDNTHWYPALCHGTYFAFYGGKGGGYEIFTNNLFVNAFDPLAVTGGDPGRSTPLHPGTYANADHNSYG